MKEIEKYKSKTFENIKRIDEFGNEYWEARELQKVLEYTEWRKFNGVIDKAMKSCEHSKQPISDHFVGADKIVKTGAFERKIQDYYLSRYACYLIVQNGDSRKEVIALGQTYFAVQTRKQELSDQEYDLLSEDEKRFYVRNLTKKGNYELNQVALKAGVKNFSKFHNEGYKGLYAGETAADIAKRKKLRYREEILDNMGSDELAANLFRISQAKQKIKNEQIKGQENANSAHYQVGKKVRETIKELGGTMPEELPTPEKSLKELAKQKSIKVIK